MVLKRELPNKDELGDFIKSVQPMAKILPGSIYFRSENLPQMNQFLIDLDSWEPRATPGHEHLYTMHWVKVVPRRDIFLAWPTV